MYLGLSQWLKKKWRPTAFSQWTSSHQAFNLLIRSGVVMLVGWRLKGTPAVKSHFSSFSSLACKIRPNYIVLNWIFFSNPNSVHCGLQSNNYACTLPMLLLPWFFAWFPSNSDKQFEWIIISKNYLKGACERAPGNATKMQFAHNTMVCLIGICLKKIFFNFRYMPNTYNPASWIRLQKTKYSKKF